MWNELTRWYYLIYLLPLGLAGILLLGSALMSGDGDNNASHDAGMDADAGHDFGMDSDTGHDLGLDADGDADLDADGDLGDGDADGDLGEGDTDGSQPSFGHALFSFFGFGKAPVSLLAQGFFLAWGAVGFYATRLFEESLDQPTQFVPAGMAVAAVSGMAGMKALGAFGSRYMKSVETYSVSGDDLVGEIGVVVFPISETMGRVHVYDRHGALHIESGRVEPGQPSIERNASVILVARDDARDLFRVERSPV